jgi:hypothetical protein
MTITKVTIGVLLVVAMAIPVSAGVIGSPSAPVYLSTSLIDSTAAPGFVDGSTLTSFSSGGLTVGLAAGQGAQWYNDGLGPASDAIAFATDKTGADYVTSLTLEFNSPVTVFGFQAIPNDLDQAYSITANFYSSSNGTGAVLDTVTESLMGGYNSSSNELTGWGFFGAADDTIGSVVISTTDTGAAGKWDTGGFVLSELRYGTQDVAPEPATSLLFAAGLVGLGLVSRRRLAR